MVSIQEPGATHCNQCGKPFWRPVVGDFSFVKLSDCCVCHVVHAPPYFAPNPPAALPGCQPDRPLTEADVRRIVREEIALGAKEKQG